MRSILRSSSSTIRSAIGRRIHFRSATSASITAIRPISSSSSSSSLSVSSSSLSSSSFSSSLSSFFPSSSVRFFSSASSIRPPLTDLSEDERALVDAVQKFCQTELSQERVRSMDEKGKFDKELLQALFDNGLMGIEIPEKYGGSGMSFFQSILAIEEIAKADPALAVLVDIQNTLIDTIVGKYGSEYIRDKYLPQLATSAIGSFCLSEAGSGSDAFAMKTVAKKTIRKNPETGKDEEGFIINGSKMWISNSEEAEIFLIFANAAPDKGYKGITCFLAERSYPGLKVGKKENKLGIRASSTCEVTFEDLFVPATNVVGKFGEGYKIAIGCLNEGRIGIAAQMLGLAEGAFNIAVPYTHQRVQFGQPIANFQGMQFQIAETALSIETAKLLIYNAARLKESNLPFVKEASMAKLHASRVAEKSSSLAIEWMGGLGFVKDSFVEKYYRDAKIGAIYEGTSNLQLQTIAKLLAKDHGGK